MKRLATLLVVVVVAIIWMSKPSPVQAISSCSSPTSNANKAGIMIDTHHGDYAQAANLVGAGGWVVELAFPDTGLTLQNHLTQNPNTNMVIWGMPGEGTKADADGWCATLGKLDTGGKKVYFKPWNTANSTDPNDTYAVKGTPQQVADYQNNLYSCLSESGLLNNKVVLLSPVLITGSDVSYPYQQYFDAIKNTEEKKYVGRSLYDVWTGGAACTAPGIQDNACKTSDFAKSVGGQYTFAVEGGVANPTTDYKDDEMAALINKMADPNVPGSWVSDPSFIMGAMYANDPDTYGDKWNIWKNGPKTRAAYANLRTNGCVSNIENQSEIDKNFATWFETIRTLIVPCDNFGYSSKKELCDAPPNVGQVKSGEFPPLGTLQSCPAELPVVGKLDTPPGGEIGRCSVPVLPEPEMCKNPPALNDDNKRNAFCSNDGGNNPGGIAVWCYPESCAEIARRGLGCAKDRYAYHPGQNFGCGKAIVGVCLDNGGSEQAHALAMSVKTCSGKPYDIGRCSGYYEHIGRVQSPTAVDTFNGLPACVPTTYANKPYPNKNVQAQCVSECSEPLDIVQNVSLTAIGNCNKVNGGTCNAKIKIQEKTFTLPIAKNLADYFAGTLDAGESAPDVLKKAYQNPQTMLSQAGVAKKLLPNEIQDQLKCQFLKDTVNRMARHQNTKYAFTQNGAPQVFRIDGIPITQFASLGLPPYFDRSPASDCTRKPASQSDINDWAIDSSYGAAWKDVPLFSNEDAQGEIQFVSPSLFSIEPVQVSIPEVNRLNAATAMLQSILVPSGLQALKQPPQTYGKTISFNNKDTNVCKPTPVWANYYPGADYERAVVCKISPAPVPGGPDSQVCVLEPNGVINCQRQDPTLTREVVDQDPDTKVQVRTIFPGFFDIAEQTISQFTGLLRIFKPTIVKQSVASGRDITRQEAADDFESHFAPTPVTSDPIHYEVTVSNTLQLKPKDDGWRIFFYKLGGVWNARNFVLDLLNPEIPKKTGP